MSNYLSSAILNKLQKYLEVNSEIDRVITRSCYRIIDAKMIIEDIPCDLPISKDTKNGNSILMDKFDTQRHNINLLLKQIENEGIGLHLSKIVGEFACALLNISASASQLKEITSLINSGILGSFLMTDAGGSSLNQYKSEVFDMNGQIRLNIDKIHSMRANQNGFGVVVVKKCKSFLPQTYLLKPEKMNILDRIKIGEAWFDGQMYLGNVKGQICVTDEDKLSNGNIIAINQILSFARPNLVRSFIAHIQWLNTKNRVLLHEAQNKMLINLDNIAVSVLDNKNYSSSYSDDVKALKFTSNEIILDLVTSGNVPDSMDQRDLLGFTKMEGSSYRCFYEVWSNTKR